VRWNLKEAGAKNGLDGQKPHTRRSRWVTKP